MSVWSSIRLQQFSLHHHKVFEDEWRRGMTSAHGDRRDATAAAAAAAAVAAAAAAAAAGNGRQCSAVVAEEAESVSASAVGGRTEGQRLEADSDGVPCEDNGMKG